jgi:hypothetical protein
MAGQEDQGADGAATDGDGRAAAATAVQHCRLLKVTAQGRGCPLRAGEVPGRRLLLPPGGAERRRPGRIAGRRAGRRERLAPLPRLRRPARAAVPRVLGPHHEGPQAEVDRGGGDRGGAADPGGLNARLMARLPGGQDRRAGAAPEDAGPAGTRPGGVPPTGTEARPYQDRAELRQHSAVAIVAGDVYGGAERRADKQRGEASGAVAEGAHGSQGTGACATEELPGVPQAARQQRRAGAGPPPRSDQGVWPGIARSSCPLARLSGCRAGSPLRVTPQ